MNRLKQLRKEKKISLRDLEERLHVSKSSLSRLENGEREAKESMIKDLAEFFGVSVEYLLGISDIRTPHEPFGIPNQKVLDELGDDQELIKTFHELIGREDTALLFHKMKTMTPQDAKKVLKIIKAIEDEESEGK